MLKAPLTLAVVGVGKLGELHAKLLSELVRERNDARFVGVFDINGARADEIARRFSVQSFSTLDDVARAAQAAFLSTTTSSHYAIAKFLLSKGVHLFIEKPITTTVREADELIALEKHHGVKLQVGHIERFNPALRSIDGLLGTPMFIAAERLSGFSKRATDVSVVLDLMIHDIDLILSLVRSPVTQVAASGMSVFSNELDIANARLEFENGAVATVTASRISRTKVRKMRLFCADPNSYASLDLTTGKAEVFRLVEKPSGRKKSLKEKATEKVLELFGDIEDALNGKTIEYLSPDSPKVNALKLEQDSFLDAVLYDKPIRVSSLDGRRALDTAVRITTAIQR
ncbi:MAG: oxidoreductase [[Candidatus Thermochlorobacteriaceae] bacterium GBChlB]|nr:MAG: oxidoreductase [[Candidatus Thermochlorobacteriaceae] bacterium GBChlB]